MLFFFAVLLLVLSLLFPYYVPKYLKFVDWNTLMILFTLLVVVAGFRESGYFAKMACGLLERSKDARSLAYKLVGTAFVLSPLITNDVALFVVVPITLELEGVLGKDMVERMVFLEVLAVNAGSSLTPIGNPQNVFIWRKWDVDFHAFILVMLPVVLLMGIALLFYVKGVISKEILDFEVDDELPEGDRFLFWISLVLFVLYVIFTELDMHIYAFLVVVFVIAMVRPRVFRKVDWKLLILFAVVFVDFGVLGSLRVVRDSLSFLSFSGFYKTFLVSLGVSQLFSNVPATVLVAKFSHNWRAIAYGVNVGGNGLFIASFANIIALRMLERKGAWLRFHLYSLSYLLVTLVLLSMLMMAAPKAPISCG